MQPPAPLAETLRLMAKEARRRVVALAAIFAVVALATLVFGAVKPREYEAHAVILVEARNIITPLMEGRAVATGVTDQAAIASQAMQSHRILREILAFGGWRTPEDPRDEERMMDKLSARVRITRPRAELVKISFVDTEPERCLSVTKKLADVYIREALFGKSRQSTAAFDFIDRQVVEYGAKVADAHAAVQAYYKAHPEPKRAAGQRPPDAVARPRSPDEIAALRAEAEVLAAELQSDQSQLVRDRRAQRIEQLERELDSLRRTYTDKHPSVQRVTAELQAAKEDAARLATLEDRTARSTRVRLDEVRRRLEQLGEGGELRAPPPLPAAPALPPSPAEVIATQDSTLTELIRRYESTRDVYQDLLKRRENARVSMDLDEEKRGLTLRVYEEPELPVLPIGLRLAHVWAIGITLALAAPIALLFAFVRLDPRVRSAQGIERIGGAPLLVTIPWEPTQADRTRARRQLLLAAALVAGVFASYAVFLYVRFDVDLKTLVDAGRRLVSS